MPCVLCLPDFGDICAIEDEGGDEIEEQDWSNTLSNDGK